MADINELLKQKMAKSSAIELGLTKPKPAKKQESVPGKEDEWKYFGGEASEAFPVGKVQNVALSRAKKRAEEEREALEKTTAPEPKEEKKGAKPGTKEIKFGNVPVFFGKQAEEFPSLEEAKTMKPKKAEKKEPIVKPPAPPLEGLAGEAPRFINTRKKEGGPTFTKLEDQKARLPPEPVFAIHEPRKFNVAGEEKPKPEGGPRFYKSGGKPEYEHGKGYGREHKKEYFKEQPRKKSSMGEDPEKKTKAPKAGESVATFKAAPTSVT